MLGPSTWQKIYFGSQFQRFWATDGQFHCCRHPVTQNIMEKGCVGQSFSLRHDWATKGHRGFRKWKWKRKHKGPVWSQGCAPYLTSSQQAPTPMCTQPWTHQWINALSEFTILTVHSPLRSLTIQLCWPSVLTGMQFLWNMNLEADRFWSPDRIQL